MVGAPIGTERIVNDRSADNPASGQCEVSVAAFGHDLVAVWNDGEGFETKSSTVGFGYSTDDGLTWVDGGSPPVTGGVRVWTSDPVVTVNEKTGAFYFSALCDPSVFTNGIGVVKGTFSGGRFAWGSPRVAVSAPNTSAIYDKEWLAADSLSGRLFLTYSRFTVVRGVVTNNRIELVRNTSDNVLPWAAPVQLSSLPDAGRVQGPRVVVGPAGEVWAAWNAIGKQDLDFMRVRRGTRGGTFWEDEVAAASIFSNFGSGGPGFNRGLGFSFPGLAVDRGVGNSRGRVYLSWNESLNFYDDPLAVTATVGEGEPNGTPATAVPFAIGNTLIGEDSSVSDLDYWSFSGTQGQTVICELDSLYTTTLDASFRLFCSDGTTRLAYSETGTGGFDNASGIIVFTLPATGTYYLRVASLAPDEVNPPGTGGYRIRTGLDTPGTERARDHRDVFVTYSDDGTDWANPVRVNREAPLYDDWLPEVAVASNGSVFVSWYDWRDAGPTRCGGLSLIYLARSNDHGASWLDGAPLSNAPSDWSAGTSNIAPNQGDYTSLFANQNGLYACWSDGRNLDPDVFMAGLPVAGQASLTAVHAQPGLARITWRTVYAPISTATVYRRTEPQAWAPLGTISPDAGGQLVFEDRSVVAGTRYQYRLGVPEGAGESFSDEVTVEVPLSNGQALAIHGVRPNPADREIWVSFTLPDATSATLQLMDVTGRRVAEREVAGAGAQLLELAAGAYLPSGIYLVRLVQGGRHAAARIAIVR